MPTIDINKKRGTNSEVPLKLAWEDSKFFDAKDELIIPVGCSQDGENVFADLAEEKHILAAGGMFSGIGMFRRIALLSLLKLNSPNTLKLIIIDPIHALKDFYSVPHLLFSPTTKLDECIKYLKWCLKETDERYQEFVATKNRNIYTYNEKSKSTMPSIVIMVSELGDMMNNETEGLVVRIAQMTKATGIHFILTTQRPSQNSITDIVRTNIPAKISFQVPTEKESVLVIKKLGAEKLVGQGDLFYASDNFKHLQGFCYPEENTESLVIDLCKKK